MSRPVSRSVWSKASTIEPRQGCDVPPEKASKTLKVGEFTKARIVGTQGHDLVAQPI